MEVTLCIFSHRLCLNGSLTTGMNDQLISVLAPDRDILQFEPRLVIAFNPLEEEKRVQTDLLLFTMCKDQPAFEARSFVYFFAGAYELKGILPFVERNARRKAEELLREFPVKCATCYPAFYRSLGGISKLVCVSATGLSMELARILLRSKGPRSFQASHRTS